MNLLEIQDNKIDRIVLKLDNYLLMKNKILLLNTQTDLMIGRYLTDGNS